MRPRRWRALLAGIVASAAVAVGIVAATTTANAAPIEDGTRASIVAVAEDETRYYLMGTGELRDHRHSSDIYTFVAKKCDGQPCYAIEDHDGCMYYDVEWKKIQYGGTCGNNRMLNRCFIDQQADGWVRIRPASHPGRCLLYDPTTLHVGPYGYTRIKACNAEGLEHRFKIARIKSA
jgi:hypothetical protein